jgi:uncharacterized membrane protein YhiD involved in acid resistance
MSINHEPDPPPDPHSEEPAMQVGGIVTLVTAAIGLLVTLGVGIDGTVATALVVFVTALAPLVSAVVTRSRVYAPATVARLLNEQAEAGRHP